MSKYTRKGSGGWNFDLVSHRNLGTQAAPGLDSASIYSCALRQSTVSKKMGIREEQHCGEKVSKYSGILWEQNSLKYQHRKPTPYSAGPFYPTGFNLLPQAANLSGT